jgi:hypothetical protein
MKELFKNTCVVSSSDQAMVYSINSKFYDFNIIGEHCNITTTAEKISILNAVDSFNTESNEEFFGFEYFGF